MTKYSASRSNLFRAHLGSRFKLPWIPSTTYPSSHSKSWAQAWKPHQLC